MLRRKARSRPPPPPPRKHPAPYKSKLWEHEELIRSMRRKRMNWVEITTCLQREHGLTIGSKTVYNFFKRLSRAKKKNRPLGFPEVPTPSAQSSPAPERSLLRPLSYNESVERARALIKQEKQTETQKDADWDLVDPSKPL